MNTMKSGNRNPMYDLNEQAEKIDAALKTIKKEWDRVAEAFRDQVLEKPESWEGLGRGGDLHALRSEVEELAGRLTRMKFASDRKEEARWTATNRYSAPLSWFREDRDRARADLSIEASTLGLSASGPVPSVIEIPGFAVFTLHHRNRNAEGEVVAWEYTIQTAHTVDAMMAELVVFNR
jgi:hypothetical protein